MPTFTREKITPEVERLGRLIKRLKDKLGSYDQLGRLIQVSPMTVNKWGEGGVDDFNNIKLGNMRAIASVAGWTLEQLIFHLETGQEPPENLPVPTQQNFSISSLSFEAKLKLNLELAKSLATQEEEKLPLDLSDRERLKLGKLVDASLTKSGELVASIANQTGLTVPFIEGIANGDEDLRIEMADLDKLAPYTYHPTRWDGNRCYLGESRLRSGNEILNAINCNNGAKAK